MTYIARVPIFRNDLHCTFGYSQKWPALYLCLSSRTASSTPARFCRDDLHYTCGYSQEWPTLLCLCLFSGTIYFTPVTIFLCLFSGTTYITPMTIFLCLFSGMIYITPEPIFLCVFAGTTYITPMTIRLPGAQFRNTYRNPSSPDYKQLVDKLQKKVSETKSTTTATSRLGILPET